MRNGMEQSASFIAIADEVVDRLARLEEQMRYVGNAVEKLATRDSEIEANLRQLAEKFAAGLAEQNEMFQNSLQEVTQSFVSREDWAFWRSLLMAALLTLVAYGWNAVFALGHR
jgi:hypothetical protein